MQLAGRGCGHAVPGFEPFRNLEAASVPADALPAVAAIVPRNSLAGRSLGAVVAIMTFLASLSTGAAMVVVSAAGDWESEVGRGTPYVRPPRLELSGADLANAKAVLKKALRDLPNL